MRHLACSVLRKQVNQKLTQNLVASPPRVRRAGPAIWRRWQAASGKGAAVSTPPSIPDRVAQSHRTCRPCFLNQEHYGNTHQGLAACQALLQASLLPVTPPWVLPYCTGEETGSHTCGTCSWTVNPHGWPRASFSITVLSSLPWGDRWWSGGPGRCQVCSLCLWPEMVGKPPWAPKGPTAGTVF